MTAIRAAAASHTGYIRTNNEDLAVVSSDLAAIADGMGGHLGGEVAARTAIEELIESFQRDRTAAGLVSAVRRANQAIWKRSRSDRSLHGMGTTLTATALVAGDGSNEAAEHLALVNVGDSRAYKLERGDPPSLSRLTEDHSLVEEMVRQGEISPAEAAVHPHRHVLTRALGIDPEVDVDIWDLDPAPGTRILLCSDGLTDDVPEEEIARVLASSEDPQQTASRLVDLALSHGGMDNVTVVVVDVLEEKPPGAAQDLELVPPRPTGSHTDEDQLRSDVTQALPVTAPPAASAGAASEELGAAGAAAAGEPTVGMSTDQLAVVDEPGPATSAPSAKLYDAELDEGEQTVASLAATPAADEPDESEDSAGSQRSDGTHRRRGRSMTVRGAAPALLGDGHAAGENTGSHARATVLVPAKGLSKQYQDRVLTVRVVVFLVVLAALLGGVIGVVIWFQRSSYYVGLDGDRVSIFQGRPGGLLWFKPQLLATSDVTTKNLLPNSIAEVKKGIAESSYEGAKQQVDGLARLSSEIGLSPGKSAAKANKVPTSTTTTSTTAAKSTAFVSGVPPLVGAFGRQVASSDRSAASL